MKTNHNLKRKDSIKQILTRPVDQDSLRFLKVFLTKKPHDTSPKIGILISENRHYSFLVFDIDKSKVIRDKISKFLKSGAKKQLEFTTDKRGRRLIIIPFEDEFILRIIAAQYLYLRVNHIDLEWLEASLEFMNDEAIKWNGN